MKMIQKLAALAALLAISVSASAESYIRPELLYGSAKMEGYSSSKIGYGVAAGTTLGAQAEHDLSLSISLTTFSQTASSDTILNGQMLHFEVELKVKPMPMLLNYRYFFLEKASPVRPYLGATLGFTQVKLDASSTSSWALGQDWRYSESKSDMPITYGATVGFVWSFSDRFALDLGYRYTTAKVEVKNWEMNENLKVSTIALGARFRF